MKPRKPPIPRARRTAAIVTHIEPTAPIEPEPEQLEPDDEEEEEEEEDTRDVDDRYGDDDRDMHGQ